MYRPVDDTAWDITATTASAPKDGSELDLLGHVEIKSSPADGSPPVSIATEQLRFVPDTSSAASTEPVTVIVGDWHFDAVGLSTHLKGDILKLESKVHGVFAPK